MRAMTRRQVLGAAAGITTAGALAPLLAGCGGGGAGDADGPLDYPSWMWEEAGTGDYWRSTVDAFRKDNPGIEVATRQVTSNGYADQITTDIAAGSYPDILPVFTNDMYALLDNDLLEPLDDRLGQTSWQDKELPLAEAAKIDGTTYGAVVTASPQALVVNKKLLKQAGVRNVPTTVDQLIDAAKRVKQKTGQWGFGFPMASSDFQNCYATSMQWVLGHDSDWAAEDGAATANAPGTVEGITRMTELVASGVMPTGMKVTDIRTLFKDGKVAMMIDGPFLLTFVKQESPDLYSECDYVLPPTPTHAAVTGGAVWVLLKDSQRLDDAWNYIDMVNQEEWQSKWIDVTAQLPGQTTEPSKEALEQGPWISNMVEIAKKYQTGFGYSPPNRQIATHASEWQKLVIDDVVPIWSGSTPVREGLDALQDKLSGWLSDKGIHG